MTKNRKEDHKKKVAIEISNRELDAMEDFLTVELSKNENEKFRKITLEVWMKLVCAFDKG